MGRPGRLDNREDEYCSYTYGDDGVFRLHLATDFETGNVIRSALDEAHDRLFQAGQKSVTTVDAIRRYITCDGLLSPVFVEQGVPVSVGSSVSTTLPSVDSMSD